MNTKEIYKKFKMNRTKIQMEDRQIRVFNGRGWICPQQYSITGFIEPNFATLHAFYGFRFDILDIDSETIIWDDVPRTWDTWINKGEGTDPLGANFRSNFKNVVVSQDAYCEPGKYTSTGVFNNKIKDSIINLKLKCEFVVSHLEDDVILKYTIKNLGDKDKKIKLLPKHSNTRTKKDFAVNDSLKPIKISDDVNVKLNSSLKGDKNSFDLFLKKGEEKIIFTRLHFYKGKNNCSNNGNIEAEYESAVINTKKRMDLFLNKLPVFQSDNKKLENLYYKTILTMNECMWNRDDFVVNPFWSVGSWLFTIGWDTQFSKEPIALIDANSLLQSSWLPFTHGKLMKTYVTWQKEQSPEGYIFYIQEPSCVMNMITTYLKYTNDVDSLLEARNGKTLVGWFKAWAERLVGFTNDGNLIDAKDNTEVLIEIRTRGYDHVVPNVNIIVAEYFKDLAYLCKLTNDKDEKKFKKMSIELIKLVEEKLWDEKNWWFSNLYSDGKRKNIYTYHLFDSLGSSLLSYDKKFKLMTHIKESEFLGKYGFYSIAKRDEQHYDQIDSDWGGGGQYAGMPGRIVKNVFALGNTQLGFDILNKLSKLTDVFPYQPQNARTESPIADLSSMPIEISSGANIEAIIFGIFGIVIKNNEIMISPNYHESLGYTSLNKLRIRGHLISIELFEDKYHLEFDNKAIESFYGNKEKFKL